jgi:Zinc finger, C2H2 type
MRVHTGEKPHGCEYPGCNKTFGDSSSLARHRRTHTGKRPYKCEDPICEKTFTRRTTLTAHMRTHDPHWEPDPNMCVVGINADVGFYADSFIVNMISSPRSENTVKLVIMKGPLKTTTWRSQCARYPRCYKVQKGTSRSFHHRCLPSVWAILVHHQTGV